MKSHGESLMDGKKLLIIAPDAGASASELVGRVMAEWDDASSPEIKCQTLDHVQERGVIDRDVAIVWLLCDSAQPPHLYQVIEVIQESHIPAMLSRPHESKPLGATFNDGIVIGPPETDAATLCAMLKTLMSQTGEIAALRTEIKVLRAHHGGLCGQIQTLDE